MPVSKRLRYEVLRRDDYACRYCGAKAPEAALTVDHVVPVALGGTDDPSNLAAACGDCNGGKTSSSPDAPLVADVAEDALRWSRALAVAAKQMQAEIAQRQGIHREFDALWSNWTYGSENLPIPRPNDWRTSVDNFLAAGLPLDVLKWCAEKALASKASPDGTWKYMCGIAWSKVTELQEAARKAAGQDAAEQSPCLDPYERGRLEFARELLEEVTQDERDYFLEQADINDYLAEVGDEPQTETQITCYAVSAMLNSVRCDWDYLVTRVEEALRALPDGIGERALQVPQERLASLSDPYGPKTFGLAGSLNALDDLLRLPAARTYMDALPDKERDEWLRYAHALYPHAEFDEDRWLVRAANCAQVIADGRLYDVMCAAPGEHIPACPRRASYYVHIAEFGCCGPDKPPDHKGHRICEHHLEQLVDGTYLSPKGHSLTAQDYREMTRAETDEVPF